MTTTIVVQIAGQITDWLLANSISSATSRQETPQRLDVAKLNKDSMRQAFINAIYNQLGAMNHSSENPEENWTVFQNVVHSSAATTSGHPSRKHQDWFDRNDEEKIKPLPLAQDASR